MRASPQNLFWVCLGLGLFLAGSILIALALGEVRVSAGQIIGWFTGRLEDPTAGEILLSLRLPRVLTAALVGGSLSLCGVVLQGAWRNSLAEPYLLGISSGAAAGAVLAMSVGLAGTMPKTILACAGAFGVIMVFAALARRRRPLKGEALILGGLTINLFFSALIVFLLWAVQGEQLDVIMFWLHGDLTGATLGRVRFLAPVTLVCAAVIFARSRELNLISGGEEAAASMGMLVSRNRNLLLAVTVILTGTAVSLGGIVGFVGLLSPYWVRKALGHDNRLVLPAAFLFGGGFLVLADLMARMIIAPAQLPVGVISAVLGAPLVMVVLIRKGSGWW